MDKNSPHGSGGISGNIVLAVVLLGGGAFVLHEVPLESSRPAANEPKVEQRFSDQDVDARLWQDPLGAVARAREELAKKQLTEAQKRTEEARHSVERVKGAIAEELQNGEAKVTVLAVMLPGGPYAEYVERRRRNRYAVLSALNTGNYVPIDTEHLGYFRPAPLKPSPARSDFQKSGIQEPGLLKLPDLVPYEWFERDARNGPRQILVLWLDDSAFLQKPFTLFDHLFRSLTPDASEGAVRWRVIGPAFSHGLRAMVKEASSNEFDTTLFSDRDVGFFSPTATATDRNLLRSPREPQEENGDAKQLTPFLESKGISLLRTIGDDDGLADKLIGELKLRGLKVQAPLPKNEEDAARDTFRGLCPRGKGQVAEAPHHIAVVAEWDTLYSRSLRNHFRFGASEEGFCVERYHYVRGLDGLLPDSGGAPATKESSGKDGDRADDNRRRDGSFIERAEGQSQFDYLRRLAERLRERDQELRATNVEGAGIRAIGVLGNDVHDKLLVLQALQPEFPNAIFFTTDLDARFLHPSQIAWTRNLVVASSYGLRLTDDLQEGTPPFRDSYQTSVFFATRVVLDQLGGNDPRRRAPGPVAQGPVQATAATTTATTTATTPTTAREDPGPQGSGGLGLSDKAGAEQPAPITQATLDGWLKEPRVFEIGRTMAFDFSKPAPPILPVAEVTATAGPPPVRCDFTLANCPDIHPVGTSRYPQLSTAAMTLIGTGLVLLLWLSARTLSPSLGHRMPGAAAEGGTAEPSRRAPRRIAAEVILVTLLVALAAWLLARYWTNIAEWLTQDGKPISLMEGISIWPTVATLVLTLLLSFYLAVRCWASLSGNLDEITHRLHLTETRKKLTEFQEAGEKKLGWWHRLTGIFRFSAPEDGPQPDASTLERLGLKMVTARFWMFFIMQGRATSRCLRSAACVALVVCFGLWLFEALGESVGTPQRGETSASINHVLAIAAVVMMNFLVFYVGDATLFSVRLVRELRRRSDSWPTATIAHFESRLGKLPLPLLDQWIDLQFVALRTRSVARLIYFPFIVLSLLLVSRSRTFDDWQMPTTLLVLALLSVGIVLACVVALRWVAESSRAQALAEVKDALLKSRAPGAPNEPSPAQLDLLQRQIENLNEGAFAPFSQQPLLKAVLLPFAAVGGTTLLEYLALANI